MSKDERLYQFVILGAFILMFFIYLIKMQEVHEGLLATLTTLAGIPGFRTRTTTQTQTETQTETEYILPQEDV